MTISFQNIDITISFNSSAHESFRASTQQQLSFECAREQLESLLQTSLCVASTGIMQVLREASQNSQKDCSTSCPEQKMAQDGEMSELNLSAPAASETKNPAFKSFDFSQEEVSSFIEFLLLNGYVTDHGRPYKDLEATLNGIFFVLRTGCPWRDMPESYGRWNTVYRAFKRLSDFGAFEAFSKSLAKNCNNLEQKTGFD